MEAAPLVIGIDIAASSPVRGRGGALRAELEVVEWREADEREPGDRGRLLDWVAGLGPAVVGVDAPQRPKRALPGGAAHSRDCDAQLLHRRISVYQVPTRAEAEAKARRYAWMHTGWAYFKELGRRGYEPPAPGSPARRARPGAGGPRGVSARRLRDAARRHAAAQEHARRAAPARAHPAAPGPAVGRLLRPRLARRPHGGVHRLALRAGPRHAARRRPRRLHLAARHGARAARQVCASSASQPRKRPLPLWAPASLRLPPGLPTSRSC